MQLDSACPKEALLTPPPLIQNGKIVLQLHHIGWIVTGAFTLVAIITSGWLVNKHLRWYTNKQQQRYIVRILFMVPIYAVISFASFLFWNHSTPLLLVRDAYEAIVLTAFFYLLLTYLSLDAEEQKHVLIKRGLSREADSRAQDGDKPQHWVFPLGFVKWKPADGLFFLQLMKWGILQYCVIRPLTTLIAVVLDYIGLYCEESWGLGWGHIYITAIVSISVTIAMYCLIQLYVTVSVELSPHQPLLKLFSIKAVVFLTFWQATFLSLLSMVGVVKDTKYMTAETVNIGIGALLETFEMMLFSFLHIRAFTYKVYRPPAYILAKQSVAQTPRLKSLGHAMDFRETFREIWFGCRYMFDRVRGREPVQDLSVRREVYYSKAFGRTRASKHRGQKDSLVVDTDIYTERPFADDVADLRSNHRVESLDGEAGYSPNRPSVSYNPYRAWRQGTYDYVSQIDDDPYYESCGGSHYRSKEQGMYPADGFVTSPLRNPIAIYGLSPTYDHQSSSINVGDRPRYSVQTTGRDELFDDIPLQYFPRH